VATLDETNSTISVTVAVLGADALQFLTVVGAQFGIPPDFVVGDPSVPLALPAGSGGMKTVVHFSAYESDRSRADAVIVAGSCESDDVPAGHEPIRFDGGEPMSTMKMAARVALERMRGQQLLPMPSDVREGLHRHDRCAEPALAPAGAPHVGDQVKIQINLREDAGWLAMGGSVDTIVNANVVEAEVVATTDSAPDSFNGHFRARLERVDGWEFPWVLTSLVRR
jgi:hypothetical protein